MMQTPVVTADPLLHPPLPEGFPLRDKGIHLAVPCQDIVEDPTIEAYQFTHQPGRSFPARQFETGRPQFDVGGYFRQQQFRGTFQTWCKRGRLVRFPPPPFTLADTMTTAAAAGAADAMVL